MALRGRENGRAPAPSIFFSFSLTHKENNPIGREQHEGAAERDINEGGERAAGRE